MKVDMPKPLPTLPRAAWRFLRTTAALQCAVTVVDGSDEVEAWRSDGCRNAATPVGRPPNV